MKDNYNFNNETERKKRAVKQAKVAFITLLIAGLFLGAIVAFGVIKLMNYFGLNDKTNQVEIIKEKLN